MVGRALHFTFMTAALATGCNSIFGIHQGNPRPICADARLIDDMEDGDDVICRSGGRNGAWFDFGDGTTTGDLTPKSNERFKPTQIEDGARGTSQYAARFSGSGFTVFGAIMGFEFRDPKQPFDAGGLGGVTFWMKSNSPVSVDFPTSETVPTTQAGQCAADAAGTSCNNHFSFRITAPAPGWSRYEVPFNALGGGGGSAKWNPQHLIGINFRVTAGAAFDVWVDDIAFYDCAGPECEPTCTDPAFPVRCRAMGGPRSSCQPPGTNCAAVANECTDPLLIDDMEDGNSAICDSGGRQGFWFSIGDGTSTDLTPREGGDFLQTSIPGGRPSSQSAARLTGSGFTDWGSLMGFDLTLGQPYDASWASGIRFWMKNNVPARVSFDTAETVPGTDSPGGQCVDRAGEYNCYNDFSFAITAPSSDWVQYDVPYSAFGQADGTALWDPSHLLDIKFGPAPNTTFDIWVDDVQFYDCSASSSCLPTCADPVFPVHCPANARSPAGCRPRGTDCGTYVPGCGAATTRAPVDGRIATFMGPDVGTDIVGDIFAVGDPAPTYTMDGTLHITLNAPATSTSQELLVVDHFQGCVDAATFTGLQFSISGSLSGCTLRYFTQDSLHLYDDGYPMSHGKLGTGLPGARAPFAALMAGQVTSVPQTVMVPFAAASGGFPPRPIDPTKITGFGWAFVVDPSTGDAAPSCIADLTIDDVRFY